MYFNLFYCGALFPEMGSAEHITEAIYHVNNNAGKLINKWVAVFEYIYPGCDHGIPSSKEMNMGKLMQSGVAMGTTVTALKTKTLLVDKIQTVVVEMAKEKDINLDMAKSLSNLNAMEEDYHNYLWNTWKSLL